MRYRTGVVAFRDIASKVGKAIEKLNILSQFQRKKQMP
ncbi:hypothetical protein S7335_2257 [Synechococcus sp. PCC 7335]|nr:hypothetical protein S7335_2257 [Synechococcus sp. PCC 7335]